MNKHQILNLKIKYFCVGLAIGLIFLSLALLALLAFPEQSSTYRQGYQDGLDISTILNSPNNYSDISPKLNNTGNASFFELDTREIRIKERTESAIIISDSNQNVIANFYINGTINICQEGLLCPECKAVKG